MKRLYPPVVLSVLALAGCVPPPRVPPPAPVLPASTAPPRPTTTPVAGTDSAIAPGTWRYVQGSGETRATYGQSGAAVEFFLRCDLVTRQVLVAMRDVPGQAANATISLSATTATASYPATPDALGYRRAELTATDPVLDAVAFSRGRFTVASGARRLVLPTWPEFARVVEDCRG